MYRLINWAFDQINKESPVLISTPNRAFFGTCAEEIFHGLLKAKRDKKKALFVYPRLLFFSKSLKTLNRELFHLQSDYSIRTDNVLGALAGWLLTFYIWLLLPLWAVREFLALPKVRRVSRFHVGRDSGYRIPRIGSSALWKPPDVTAFSWEVVEALEWKRHYAEYAPPRLGQDQRRYGNEVTRQMGIPPGDWFMCLHVREGSYSTARNGSIHNYIEAIKVITAAGGWVVRLGDPSMTPLPPMARVVDYAHTAYKSALMDIYLFSECRFFIGTGSGPFYVAKLFRKPTILVNLADWSLSMPLAEGDLAILKHVYSRAGNRFLSIEEILEAPITVQTAFGPPNEDFQMEENGPEEIREVVEEFLAKQEPYEYSDLQKEFNEGRRRQIRAFLAQEPRDRYGAVSKRFVTAHYRLAAMVDAAGSIGQKYVERNWLADERNTTESRPAGIQSSATVKVEAHRRPYMTSPPEQVRSLIRPY